MYVPTETDHWVSEDFMLLSEIIKDYDYNLELRWIPPENRKTLNEQKKPYVIWNLSLNIPVRYISQGEDPREVLAMLFTSDNRHGNVLERIEALETAQRAFEMKKDLEDREELMDKAAFLMASKKNYIHFNGKKLDDQLREVPGSRKRHI